MRFIVEVFNHFSESNTFQKGASLVYYAVFSLLPIIIIINSLLGFFFGKQAVSGEIYTQLNGVLGHDAAIQIQNIIKNQHIGHNSLITSVIGFVTLAFSASGMFSQVHNSVNSIWNIKAKPKSSILNYLSQHIIAFLILIGSFFIILTSTAVSTFIMKHSDNFHSDYRFSYLYEHFLSFAVMSIVFMLMFRYLGYAIVYWKAIIAGGLITSLLLFLEKLA